MSNIKHSPTCWYGKPYERITGVAPINPATEIVFDFCSCGALKDSSPIAEQMSKETDERKEVKAVLRNLYPHSPAWVRIIRSYIRKLERVAKAKGAR